MVATQARFRHDSCVNGEPENYNVPTWKFVTALVVTLLLIFLGTLFWMWRDTKPRRKPAILSDRQPVETNSKPSTANTNR